MPAPLPAKQDDSFSLRSPQGRDYYFERYQDAIDASDVLRKRRIHYDLEVSVEGRRPWYNEAAPQLNMNNILEVR